MSEVPLQWLKYCTELVPSDILFKFRTTHILNPNALTLKFLRRLYNLTAGELLSFFIANYLFICATGAQFCSEVRAYTSVAELSNYVPPEALDLLQLPSKWFC
jgi:hypothetical protein